MLIFLVGYAGCGKSSLGKRLARRLGKQYVDTDTVDKWRQGFIRELIRQENVIDGIMGRME